VILWKLHIVNYIVLEAFKRINCTFTSHTIRFHNQIIPFLMVFQSSFNLSNTLFVSFLAPSWEPILSDVCDPSASLIQERILWLLSVSLCVHQKQLSWHLLNLFLWLILSKRSTQNKESSLSVHLTPRVSR
jgi:hypothetical protein